MIQLQVSWECSRKYVMPSNNSESVVMFSQQTNQRTFQLESSLYGIYKVRYSRYIYWQWHFASATFRFYLKSNSTGKKEYFEDPEVWIIFNIGLSLVSGKGVLMDYSEIKLHVIIQLRPRLSNNWPRPGSIDRKITFPTEVKTFLLDWGLGGATWCCSQQEDGLPRHIPHWVRPHPDGFRAGHEDCPGDCQGI